MRDGRGHTLRPFFMPLFTEVPGRRILGSSRWTSEDGILPTVERDAPPEKWGGREKTACRTSCP